MYIVVHMDRPGYVTLFWTEGLGTYCLLLKQETSSAESGAREALHWVPRTADGCCSVEGQITWTTLKDMDLRVQPDKRTQNTALYSERWKKSVLVCSAKQ